MKNLLLGLTAALLTFPAKSQIWDSLLGGLGNAPRILYADTVDNYMYVTGQFLEVNGQYAKGIARWNGTQWDTLGRGIDGLDTTAGGWPQNCYGIARYNNKLFVAGGFRSAGAVPAFRIATWDGSSWDTLPVPPFSPGSTGIPLVLEVINGEMYMGGVFDTIAGNYCKSLAKWNGSYWSYIGMPSTMYPNVYVNSICEYNNELYIAGNFHSTAFPNDTLTDILKYDGANWKSVGGGMHGAWSVISTMLKYNGELYVAGYFFSADGNAGNHIQKWNGTSWSDVGGGTSGINGQIHKLFVHENKLYALGVFDFAGGVPASKFAIWDGTNWCGVGSSFDNSLGAACVYLDTLYIGGGFWTIDGDSISRIAKWIGGNYVDTCGNTTSISELLIDQELVVFPNPAYDVITISGLPSANPVQIEVFNIHGQMIFTSATSTATYSLNTNSWSPGLYSIRLISPTTIVHRKVVVAR